MSGVLHAPQQISKALSLTNSSGTLQTYEGPAIDVDTVIGVLMAEDLSPAALASLKAEALGFSKALPTKKQPRAGKPLPTSNTRSQSAAAAL